MKPVTTVPSIRFTKEEIYAILPHGPTFPWHLDGAKVVAEGDDMVCVSHVLVTEKHCEGHFDAPYGPVFLMVAMIELFGHTAGVLCSVIHPGNIGIFDKKFSGKLHNGMIKPGACIEFRVHETSFDGRTATAEGVATIDNQVVITFTFQAKVGRPETFQRLTVRR